MFAAFNTEDPLRRHILRIVLFCALSFLGAWGIVFLLLQKGEVYGSTPMMLGFAAAMFCPSLASLLTRLMTKEGFGELYMRPNLRGNLRWYLIAWLLPGVLILLGGALYFLLFPQHLDLEMSAVKASVPDPSVVTPMFFAAQAALGWLSSAWINFLPALGEELGWRGYLLPKLCGIVSERTAITASGVIWGLWHAPMIALGHNYGVGYPFAPWGGILAMVAFCFFYGSFLSYLTLRTKSALPAAMAHGALNGIAALSLLVCFPGTSPFLGPLPTGLIGGSGLLCAGAYCYRLASAEPDFGEPDAGLPKAPENDDN